MGGGGKRIRTYEGVGSRIMSFSEMDWTWLAMRAMSRREALEGLALTS